MKKSQLLNAACACTLMIFNTASSAAIIVLESVPRHYLYKRTKVRRISIPAKVIAAITYKSNP
jgi:hypothetical protein